MSGIRNFDMIGGCEMRKYKYMINVVITTFIISGILFRIRFEYSYRLLYRR